MKTLGLIVNPVAGMGGSVGLKGTDGALYKEAVKLGAEPVAPGRTEAFLSHIEHRDEITLLAAPGDMGARHLEPLDIPCTVVGQIGDETTAEDTRRIAAQMVERGSTQSPGAELLIFVGGDGTARDVYDAIDCQIPVVAVPAGVKVYSAVFALNPRAAAEMVDAFVHDGSGVMEQEVLDIDEDAFRRDRLDSRHYGYLLVPRAERHLQHGKVASSGSPSVEESKKEIAAFVVEEMDMETLYLLGPGTTVRAITDALGLPKTLLGVDAVQDGYLVGQDTNERGILELLERHKKRVIVVTPLGGNGFIFGRGNKQFTPQVIERVGAENVRIIATRQKLRPLDCLRVDTGDRDVDALLSGWTTVTVGYRESRMIKVAA
ncbi:MAG: ATP-NAD kinase family protein [Anaerolineae bacterium]|jgi:predicted polyphosphate/ATP-dependent NAD kinase